MIEPLNWEWRREDEENPFRTGSTRPLRITLHTSSFLNVSQEQAAALDLIKELSVLDEIDLLDTLPNAAGYIDIGPEKPGGDYFEVIVRTKDESIRHTGVSFVKQQQTTAQSLAFGKDLNHPEVQAALRDVLIFEAHTRLGRDLLITESGLVSDRRARHLARRSNARTILDALQIIGLLLRSRDKYNVRGQQRHWLDHSSFSRSLYYWVLTRHRTPSLWHYNSVCITSDGDPSNGMAAMAASLLSRCKHALQARDLIGEAFYAPHSDASRDDTMYHFDYLTVLLVGALDAEARIAHAVYGLPGVAGNINFRRHKFLSHLRSHGAAELCDLLSDSRTQALFTLLFEVRNTIHSASLASHGFHTTGKGPGWLEIGPGALAAALWDAAAVTGGPALWGLEKLRFQKGVDGPVVEPIRLSPYAYAVRLVRDTLTLIDRIAAMTDIDRLCGGPPPSDLLEGPPDDEVFSLEVRTRIGLMA